MIRATVLCGVVLLVHTLSFSLSSAFTSHARSNRFFAERLQVKVGAEVEGQSQGGNAPMIFYPDVDGVAKNEDDEMYNMFLRQISEMNRGSAFLEVSDSEDKQFIKQAQKLGSVLDTKRLVEEPTLIYPGCPLEIAFKGRVAFGNYLRRKEPNAKNSNDKYPDRPSKSVVVQLSTGEEVAVAASQIISCWDVLCDEDEDIPDSSEKWAAVAAEALQILGNMSPRKSDLQEFWTVVSQRSSAVSVDSLDLGVYIYQERRFKAWVDPYMDAQDTDVRALSAAQRYAAALLLHHDDFHFKRRPSDLLQAGYGGLSEEDDVDQEEEGEEKEGEGGLEGSTGGRIYDLEEIMSEKEKKSFKEATDLEEDEADAACAWVVEGGYRCLDEGLVMFREGEVFQKYYSDSRARDSAKASSNAGGTATSITSSTPFRAGCITRQLRALEMFSMSPAKQAAPTMVKHLLKRLGKKSSPAGAREVIMDMRPPSSDKNDKTKVSASHEGDMRIEGGSGSGAVGYTPWTQDALSAADQLKQEVADKRAVMATSTPGKSGKKGASGSMDYRSTHTQHPAICVDGSKAVFLDDAFSLSPSTGELLVHVVDVAGVLRRYALLQSVAKERVSSVFLPSGPLHMLPAQALDSLKLSTESPNEVLTVALSIDDDSGDILGFRVFPSVIGPVFPVAMDEADVLIEKYGSTFAAAPISTDTNTDTDTNTNTDRTDTDTGTGTGIGVTGLEENRDSDVVPAVPVPVVGYPTEVVRDLVRAQQMMAKVISKNPWVDKSFLEGGQRHYSLNKRTGAYTQALVEKTDASRMLNAMLTLYSNSSCTYCLERGVNVPVAWENRDRANSAVVRRYATQPLRNWLAQLQQKQLRAALKLEVALQRKDCALAVAHHNNRKKQLASLQSKGRSIMAYESLEAHCASLLTSGSGQGSLKAEEVVLSAEGLGRGNSVKLLDFQVVGVVRTAIREEDGGGGGGGGGGNFSKGERVKVAVMSVAPEKKQVILRLVERT